jgi:hypothetical protein
LNATTLRITLALAAAVGCSAVEADAPPRRLLLWPGYSLEIPAGYLADVREGPDFFVHYVHDDTSPDSPLLIGIYSGYAPDFDPECTNAETRMWSAHDLEFQSVRGTDGCAEFLVRDPAVSDRGLLHLWFGPAARDRAQLAFVEG